MSRTAVSYLELALERIAAHPERSFFVGPAPESQIEEAEAALGFRFPESYRAFLKQLGAGSFAGSEFVGLLPSEGDHSLVQSWPDLLFVHNQERLAGACKDWLVVSEDGAGGLYVIPIAGCVSNEGEQPVMHWWRGHAGLDDKEIAASFGHFVFDIVVDGCNRK